MNAVQIQPASPEQVAEFKQAAAAYYKANNIPADTAEYLFARYMNKVANQLGFAEPKPAPVKQAAAPAPAPAEPSPKIMKLAEQLKQVIQAK